MSPLRSAGRAFALAFGPDAEAPPLRVLWGLVAAAVVLPCLGWLLTEHDDPNDLGGDEDPEPQGRPYEEGH